MSAPSSRPEADAATAGLRRVVQAVYLLHALSLVLGVAGDGLVVSRFVVGLPSLAAIVLNYLQRDTARGTPLEPHFRWQIRTFWTAAALLCGMTLLLGPLLFIGLPLLWVAYAIIGLWVGYRLVKGGLALYRGRAPS